MVKADPIARVGKVAFVDIACQLRRLSAFYPALLLSRSSVPFRDGNYDRTSERAYQIHHLCEHAWLALAVSSRKTSKKSGEKKGKAIDTPEKITIERLRHRLR